ncbi:MAG: hypothetical protein ABR530_04165 [Pyrinomonadaceae bacterium]
MWRSRNKNDLIIEVWEKLDCEDVGTAEIEAIETVITDRFGSAAIDSPMRIASLLAKEGADLRHAEILGLFVERYSQRSYVPGLPELNDLNEFQAAADYLRKLDELSGKYSQDNNKEAFKLVRDTALHGKGIALKQSESASTELARRRNIEIAEWFTIWLQTPELFESWLSLRTKAKDFVEVFGDIQI